jgi:hypothetical protein
MRKITEEDLDFGKTVNEEYKNKIVDKIVLNENQLFSNKEVFVSSSSGDSEIVGKVCESDATEVVKNDSLVSVSQYNESSTPKQEDKQLAVAGVSVALVTITEKIIDLPDSQIILNLLRARLKQENIEMSQKNLMIILKITMELIEKSPLKGLSQKEVAIQILNKLFMESKLDNDSIDVICSFLDTNLVGDTIDLIVAATKGEFDINKATKVASGCFTRIFGCFKKIKFNKRQQNKNIEFNNIRHEIEKDVEKDVENVVSERLEQIFENDIKEDVKQTPNVTTLNEILA